jgi:hypothetical protein
MEDSGRPSGAAEQGCGLMQPPMTQGCFVYRDENTLCGAAVRASVPANIVSKQVLITMLDEQLNFPSYFTGTALRNVCAIYLGCRPVKWF